MVWCKLLKLIQYTGRRFKKKGNGQYLCNLQLVSEPEMLSEPEMVSKPELLSEHEMLPEPELVSEFELISRFELISARIYLGFSRISTYSSNHIRKVQNLQGF